MGNAKGKEKGAADAHGAESKDPEDLPDGEIEEIAQANDNAGDSYSFWDRNKTFKPVKEPKSERQGDLHRTIKATMKATLGGGELRKSVKLPEGEDENEWIAVNTVHFFNASNLVYGACAEFCTEYSCPSMTAGSRYEYLWKDGAQYKKPTRVPAPVYIDNLLSWANDQISDPTLFPINDDAKFPRDFKKQIRTIFKRLFRLYAHIYYSHFEQMRAIGANSHLNTCFKHFCFFIQEFNLVEEAEMAPLKKLIDKFMAKQ